MKIVALDGVPLTNAAGNRTTRIESAPLNVPPGSRVEFLLTAPSGQSAIYLDSAAFNAGCTGNLTPERSILRFVTSGSPIEQNPAGSAFRPGLLARPCRRNCRWRRAAPSPSRNIRIPSPIRVPTPAPPISTSPKYRRSRYRARQRQITPFDMSGPPNIVINLGGQAERVEEWTIQNYTVEAHAFHIHQIHFRHILNETSGVTLQPLLDVIHVPIAAVNPDGTPGKPGEVRLRLVFPASLKAPSCSTATCSITRTTG